MLSVVWFHKDFDDTTPSKSRASASGLSTVLRTTMLYYMETNDCQIPAKPKPLSRSIRNFARLITLARLFDVSKMVGMSLMRVAPQMGKIYPNMRYNKNFSYYTVFYLTWPYLTLLFFLVSLCRPDDSTDLHARWPKQRGLLKESAF
jgi:hypothetical protein